MDENEHSSGPDNSENDGEDLNSRSGSVNKSNSPDSGMFFFSISCRMIVIFVIFCNVEF